MVRHASEVRQVLTRLHSFAHRVDMWPRYRTHSRTRRTPSGFPISSASARTCPHALGRVRSPDWRAAQGQEISDVKMSRVRSAAADEARCDRPTRHVGRCWFAFNRVQRDAARGRIRYLRARMLCRLGAPLRGCCSGERLGGILSFIAWVYALPPRKVRSMCTTWTTVSGTSCEYLTVDQRPSCGILSPFTRMAEGPMQPRLQVFSPALAVRSGERGVSRARENEGES